MIFQVIEAVVVVAITILAMLLLAYAFRRFIISSAIEIEADGYLFSRKGQKPVSFTHAVDANKYLQDARDRNIYFEIYLVENGRLQYLGSSKHFLLT